MQRGAAAHIGDHGTDDMFAGGANENTFRMTSGELPSAGGGPRPGRAPVCAAGEGSLPLTPATRKNAPLVKNMVNLLGHGEDITGPSLAAGVLFPTAFPKLVDDVHIFVRDIVTNIVRPGVAATERLGPRRPPKLVTMFQPARPCDT